jgi:outer membrane protein OmpA-like peptidoglycan-associated protein
MTRWIVFAGLTALIVTGYFATFYAQGKSFWRSVKFIPAELQSQAEAKLKEAGASPWARVQVDGQIATLSGEAPTEADRDDVRLAVRAAAGAGGPWWGGITQVRDSMTVAQPRKPYFWGAQLGTNGRVSMFGYVPGQRFYRSIKTEAHKLFPTGVDDRLEIAGGYPSGPWLQTAVWSLRQLRELQSGDAKFEDSVLTIKGEARDPQTQAAVIDAAKTIRPPYQAIANITLTTEAGLPEAPPPVEDAQPAAAIVASPVQRLAAANCQKLIDEAMAHNTIRFTATSAGLKVPNKVLDRMVQVAIDCGNVRFRITGHTDGSSLEGAVDGLSKTRAEEVANYLEAKGVSIDRIRTVGAGSSQPVGDVDTPEGQAKNRRAEISVLP